MSSYHTLLAAQTGAGNSDEFFVASNETVTVSCSPDLAGAETADIQISHDNGTTWVDYQDGAAVELTATQNALRLYGPAKFRVAKDSTAGGTGIFLTR